MDKKESRKTKRLTVLMLLVIVAIGAVFRFHNVHQVEPFLADEAIYVLEARYLYSIVESTRQSLQLKAEERKTGEDL